MSKSPNLEQLVYGLIQDINKNTESIFKNAVENIREASLSIKNGNNLDKELCTRVVDFEMELYCRQKRGRFNVTFKVKNFKSETQATKEIIRVAIVQICVPQYTSNSVPFNFASETGRNHSEKVKEIIRLVSDYNKHDRDAIDFICFPELSVPICASDDIRNMLHNSSAPYVLAGFEYDELRNPCKIFLHGQVLVQYKTSRSELEDAPFDEERMELGDFIYVFRTQKGNFAVLICSEFILARGLFLDLIQAKLKALFPSDNLNVVFVLSQNPKPDLFIKWAEDDSDRMGFHIIICNSSKYGGSSIISPRQVTKEKSFSLDENEQRLICAELDIRLTLQVMRMAFVKKGIFYTRIMELNALETALKRVLKE